MLFVSGDDLASKKTVQHLITELGYASIDLGGLDEGGRMQQPVARWLARTFWSTNDEKWPRDVHVRLRIYT